MVQPSGAATPGYIAATVPAKTDRVAGTTLFHLAMLEFGDPLEWVPIAQLNNLTDPWIFDHTDVLIPPVLPGVLRELPLIGGQPFVTPPPPFQFFCGPIALTLSSGAAALIAFANNSVPATLAFSGTVPTVVNSGSPQLAPAVAAVALAGPAPTMLHSLSMQPAAASLTLTGQSSKTPLSLQPAVRALTLTATTPTVALSLAPAAASLTLTGVAPTVALTLGPKITPVAASLTLSDPSGGPQSPVLVNWSGPTSGLVARWSFDTTGINGTTLLDLVGSNNGTITGTVATVGAPGAAFNSNALSFDGSTAFVTLGSLPISVSGAAWSIGFWTLMPDVTAGNDQGFFTFGTSGVGLWTSFNPTGSNKNGYLAVANNTSGIGLNSTGHTELISSAAQFTNSTWTHVVITFDGSATITAYFNSVKYTSFTGTTGPASSNIAFIARGSSSSKLLAGNLFQMCTYNRALTQTDVNNLYAAG